MNKFYSFLLLLFLVALNSSAQYVTIWKTDNGGIISNKSITIPATGNNYNIDWQEVSNPSNNGTATGSGTYTLHFPSAGTYQVSITPGNGTFSGIAFSDSGDKLRLLEIKQWGDIPWQTMSSAYNGCTNLTVTATDKPRLDLVTSMSNMFMSCSALTTVPGIDGWDVSHVTNMANVFRFATNFNEPIASWDVSNVTSMEGMFHSTNKFNQPIGTWNVGKVTNMQDLFYQAKAFNQPIGAWAVQNVTNMQSMFYSASAFNQPLNAWNVGKVINMSYMFYVAGNFNQPLNNWNVSKVKNMSIMFHSAAKFNQSLGDWNLNAVTNMTTMLPNSGMDCAIMSLTLMGWANNPATPDNVIFGAGTRTYGTQAVDALATLKNTKTWTVTIGVEVTCTLPVAPYVTVWKTDNPGSSASNQITIPATGTNYRISWQEVDNPANSGTTVGSGIHTLTFPSAGTYQVAITPGSGTFHRIDFSRTPDRSKLLKITQWGGIRWSDMENAYYDCYELTITASDKPDLQDVKSMIYMFFGCSFLTTVPGMDSWDVKSVTSMASMFQDARKFNQPIGSWKTGKVTNMSRMFAGANSFDQSIGSWDVSSVTTMVSMFDQTSKFNQPLEDWDVSSVTDMSLMFQYTGRFNQPIAGWDMSSVTRTQAMFYNASSFNQPVNNWNVSSAANMESMFLGAQNFNQSLAGWAAKLNANVDLTNFIGRSGLNTANYDATLIAFSKDAPTGITMGAANLNYCSSHDARANLVLPIASGGKGWTILGDIDQCPLPVTLVSLSGKKTAENQNTLQWITSDEKDFDRFEIQRSADAKSFETIGNIVPAESGQTALRSYQFIDQNAGLTHYYRLKMIDTDGTFEYSRIISIANAAEKSIIGSFYPNPAQGTSSVDIFATENGNWTISVIDISGKTIRTSTRKLVKGMNKIELDKFSPGLNLIKFNNEKTTEVRKLVKQ